jgi:poly-gamma-glutamate synthesis protein (capsule biosynthesis protein)
MSCKKLCLILLFFCGPAFSQHLFFTGDVSLSRNVAREIEYTHSSPWKHIRALFPKNNVIIGNFESAIGSEKLCAGKVDERNPCFAVHAQNLKYLKDVPFNYLSLENNHAMDLGKHSAKVTQDAFQKLDITALTFEDSPQFISINGVTIGLVSYSEIPGKNELSPTYSALRLSQKIKLANALANMVVVYVHWGNELLDWPTPDEREKAKWLIQQGADMIIGHHPHVIQKAECILGKPVLFSLGNHIFDQKYPITKRGSVIDCVPSMDKFSCKAYIAETPSGSSFPISYKEDKNNYSALQTCPPLSHPQLQVQNYTFKPHLETTHENKPLQIEIWAHQQRQFIFPASTLLTMLPAHFTTKEHPLLLTLQKQYSPIDLEHAPRPYVYDVGPHGLIAKWRGSALSWPLLDITLIQQSGKSYLCALHRGDSFLNLNPTTSSKRTQVYQWNGFGFSGVSDQALTQACALCYKSFLDGSREKENGMTVLKPRAG